MRSWERSIINIEATLNDALRQIDLAANRILLVVDSEMRLVGTITDGDIRRALLYNSDVEVAIRKVMNHNPKWCNDTEDTSEILQMMKANSIHHMPILSKDGVIVGLKLIENLLEKERLPNVALLMAGGFGKRLYPLTANCPKPMLKLGGKPILERILENCILAGFEKFFISTHYMPEVIMDYFESGEKWGVSIEYINEVEPMGTGGALSLLPKHVIIDTVLVINGDLLTNVSLGDFLLFHESSGADISVCVREYESQIPFGVLETSGHVIHRIVEKPKTKVNVNAGIYLIEPEVLNGIEESAKFDMPELMSRCLDGKKAVHSYRIQEQWIDIGRMSDFERASGLYGNG